MTTKKTETLDPFVGEGVLEQAMDVAGSRMVKTSRGVEISIPFPGTKCMVSGGVALTACEAAERTLAVRARMQQWQDQKTS